MSSIASALSSKESDAAATATTGSTGTGATKRNDTIGQPEFLNLLVAQLQNQDPLNPLDSADFSAQLAQFSSLEQLMQINQRLTELGQPGDPQQQSFDPVGLLGRDVSAVGSAVSVAGGDASALEYTLASAGKVTVEVRSDSGTLISTAELGEVGAGSHVARPRRRLRTREPRRRVLQRRRQGAGQQRTDERGRDADHRHGEQRRPAEQPAGPADRRHRNPSR